MIAYIALITWLLPFSSSAIAPSLSSQSAVLATTAASLLTITHATEPIEQSFPVFVSLDHAEPGSHALYTAPVFYVDNIGATARPIETTVTFTIEDGECRNPRISFSFRENDFSGLDEYIELYQVPRNFPDSHWIVNGDGNDENEDTYGINKIDECAPDVSTHSIQSNKYGNGIGTQCCSDDGTQPFRHSTVPSADCSDVIGLTFTEAEQYCAERGYRLCTRDEILSIGSAWSGCYFDVFLVWTADRCYGKSIARCGDNGADGNCDAMTTCANEVELDLHNFEELNEFPDRHWIVDGDGDDENVDNWGINKVDECAPDHSTHSVQSNEAGNDIGTQCCSDDGTQPFRHSTSPSGDCSDAIGLNFAEAEQYCTENGYRLCTRDEILSIGHGPWHGCSFDAFLVWTADSCSVSSMSTSLNAGDSVDIVVYVSEDVDGIDHVADNQAICAGQYNVESQLTLTCQTQTLDPTADPTPNPTPDPTNDPTPDPTSDPTADPTTDPTRDPTSAPTAAPTVHPTTDLYMRVDELLSRDEAEVRCQELFGSNLASIHSQYENDEAYELCASDRPSHSKGEFVGCWIGVNHDGSSNFMGWTDSSTLDYVNWRDGAPNGGAQYNFMKVNSDDFSYWEDTTSTRSSKIPRFLCNANSLTSTAEPDGAAAKTETVVHVDPTESPTTIQAGLNSQFISNEFGGAQQEQHLLNGLARDGAKGISSPQASFVAQYKGELLGALLAINIFMLGGCVCFAVAKMRSRRKYVVVDEEPAFPEDEKMNF